MVIGVKAGERSTHRGIRLSGRKFQDADGSEMQIRTWGTNKSSLSVSRGNRDSFLLDSMRDDAWTRVNGDFKRREFDEWLVGNCRKSIEFDRMAKGDDL